MYTKAQIRTIALSPYYLLCPAHQIARICDGQNLTVRRFLLMVTRNL